MRAPRGGSPFHVAGPSFKFGDDEPWVSVSELLVRVLFHEGAAGSCIQSDWAGEPLVQGRIFQTGFPAGALSVSVTDWAAGS